jgi:phospholipase C
MLVKIGMALAMAGIIMMGGCSDGKDGAPGATGAAGPAGPAGPTGASGPALPPDAAAQFATPTPIKHVVVIFGENISFDHYFGTYPTAANLAGETPFHGTAPTNGVNNLSTPLNPAAAFAAVTGVDLLNNNPNGPTGSGIAGNAANAANPFRLAPSLAATADQGHNYTPEQQASDNGLMDLFPQFTGTSGPPPGGPASAATKGLVMAYYDGNTVTALWTYAQNFALNDNSFSSQYGPSTPGAINLISGQTNGVASSNKDLATFSSSHMVADGNGGYTMIGDVDPLGDVCSTSTEQVLMAGKNVGDLLNAAHISWGSFMGGFDLTVTNPNGTTGCSRETNPTVANFNSTSADYIPHHAWFQYYASTANPTHKRPSSLAAIGSSFETYGTTAEPANHGYDTHDFFDALSAGYLPAVSFLKAPAYQDGHAGYSNPVDEQAFIISVINALEKSPMWASTAVIIAYDDSDGWYDHQFAPVANPSASVADKLNGAGVCNAGLQQGTPTPATALLGTPTTAAPNGLPAQGRCGYGTRQPLLVVSSFAKVNYVDHTLTDQSSILKFVEDNWLAGARVQAGGSFDSIAGPIDGMFSFPAAAPHGVQPAARKLMLDVKTGQVVD